jgi:hypothetical protein
MEIYIARRKMFHQKIDYFLRQTRQARNGFAIS